jgi:hypothetical protein
MNQFAPPQKVNNKGKAPVKEAPGCKSGSISASIDHILHLHQTIGNQAVQRMFKSGTLQLKDNRPQPGDVYTREIERLEKSFQSSPSVPAQQKTEPVVQQHFLFSTLNHSSDIMSFKKDEGGKKKGTHSGNHSLTGDQQRKHGPERLKSTPINSQEYFANHVSDIGNIIAGLKCQTVKGIEPQTCGNFIWEVKWQLDEDTEAGGWVVQHIDEKFNIINNKGSKVTVDDLLGFNFSERIPFYEAWEIKAGKKATGEEIDDTFGLAEFKNTKGTMVLDAKANFYEGYNEPSTWDTTYKIPYGRAPRTQANPRLPDPIGPDVVRKLTIQWNCIEDDPDYTDNKTKIS